MQVRTCFRTRDADLKTKTTPVTLTLKPDAVIQSSRNHLGPCKNKPSKKLKSSPLAVVLLTGSIENFAILTH